MHKPEIPPGEQSVREYAGTQFAWYFLGPNKRFSFQRVADQDIPNGFDIPLPRSPIQMMESGDVLTYINRLGDNHFNPDAAKQSDRFWAYLSEKRDVLERTLGPINFDIAQLHLKYIADPALSPITRTALARDKFGLTIPSPGPDPGKRSLQLYSAIIEKIQNQGGKPVGERDHLGMPLDKETIIQQRRFQPEVYQEFRGGAESGRKQIETFDAFVYYLLSRGDLVIQDAGRMVKSVVDPSHRELFTTCDEVVRTWRQPEKPYNRLMLAEEINAGVERLSLQEKVLLEQETKAQHEARWGKGQSRMIPCLHENEADQNVGYIVTGRLVLTEPTRAYLQESGLLRKAYLERVKKMHADVKGKYREANWVNNQTVSLNNAKAILEDPNKFRRWQNGEKIESIK